MHASSIFVFLAFMKTKKIMHITAMIYVDENDDSFWKKIFINVWLKNKLKLVQNQKFGLWSLSDK